MPLRILSVSSETRRLLVREGRVSEQFSVLAPRSPGGAITLLASIDCSVVLVEDTVARTLRKSLIPRLREIRPMTKILFVTNDRNEYEPLADIRVDVSDDASRLIDMLTSLSEAAA